MTTVIRKVFGQNASPADVTLIAIAVNGGANRELGTIDSEQTRNFVLNRGQGFHNGDVFRIRVRTDQGAEATSPTQITFTDAADTQANFYIDGTAVNPTITFGTHAQPDPRRDTPPIEQPEANPTISRGTYMLHIRDPDSRWLNITSWNGKPTHCVNDGSGGTRWTIVPTPGSRYHTLKADDGSFLCPAPVPSEINLHHRTDVAYGWQLEVDGSDNDTFRIVDPVSTLAVAILGSNGVHLAEKSRYGLFFKFRRC